MEILLSLKFVDPVTGQRKYVPTVSNWISNLKKFIYLRKKMLDNSFRFIVLRNFNQDPIENFFGCIRSHGVRNTNPSCAAFSSSFKTLIINNFLSSSTINFNCEEDDTTGALNNLASLIYSENVELEGREEQVLCPNIEAPVYNIPSQIDEEAVKYVSGYVIQKLLKKINCITCKNYLTGPSDSGSVIAAREYKINSLKTPSRNFLSFFKEMYSIYEKQFSFLIYLKNVKKNFISILNNRTKFYNQCPIHTNIKEESIEVFTTMILFMYLKNLNNLLSGKSEKTYNDTIKKKAVEYYNKKRKMKKK